MVVAETALKANDPARRYALMATLGRRLPNAWKDARGNSAVIGLIETSLADPSARIPGIALALASYDARYGPALMGFAADAGQAEDVRVAAVEAVGRIRPPKTAEFLDTLIAESRTREARPRWPRPPSGRSPSFATPTRSSWP